MKYIIRFLFIAVTIGIGVGYYFKNTGNHPTGDKCIGISILIASFLLMPLFIYHRWKDKKVKDYMLTDENLKKMRDFNSDEKK
ncbi:hypothetical protein ACFSTE_07110 [Aquimarina hainanensis]|uniref:Uncharacterized protein n=1 Tax=Aquimarina hainanensis TaxID=1578017 RepID=A0ABW5N7L5_9FLAO|nr:hypothetical protein [Aquimarina sp. TRL1]QKX05013.1 hypothetical protein HN014_08820 [Aquimarina sp. TRL1]